MFFSSFKLGFGLLLLAWGLFLLTGPFFAYLKRLDMVIKQGRVREIGLRLGNPSEMPHLDIAALERATEEIQALGFVYAGDCLLVPSQTARPQNRDAPIASPVAGDEVPPETSKMDGFSRVLLHERERCVAKIIASTTAPIKGGSPTTMFLRAFVSYADAPDGRELWEYGTSDLQYKATASAISKLWRQSRSIGTNLPNTPLREMWRVHLQRRAQIAEVAGLQWNRATLDESFKSNARAMRNIRACFKQLTPLKMAWRLWRFKREGQQTEWLGELRGKLPPLSP